MRVVSVSSQHPSRWPRARNSSTIPCCYPVGREVMQRFGCCLVNIKLQILALGGVDRWAEEDAARFACVCGWQMSFCG